LDHLRAGADGRDRHSRLVEAQVSVAKPGRVSRRLAGVWILLAAMVALIAFDEFKDRAAIKVEEETRDERILLPVSILDIGAVEVLSKGTLHRFERDAAGLWFYHGVHGEDQQQHEHTVDTAAAAQIDKAMI